MDQCAPGWLGIPRNDREDLLAEVVRLAVADAVDVTEFVLALRLRSRDFAQRRVVKDDVGRHTPAARNFQSQDAQLLEQVAIDALPSFGLDAGAFRLAVLVALRLLEAQGEACRQLRRRL